MPLTDMLVANGRGDIEVDPAAAQDAFTEAVANLPAIGGVIDCYGSSTWTFTDFAEIDKPNVRINFNFATMRGSPGMSRAFQVVQPGFRAHNPKFVQPGATSASFSCFLFTQGATDYLCNSAGVYDGEFDLACTTNAQRVYAVQAIGSGSSKGMHGLHIVGNRFSPLTASTQQAVVNTTDNYWGVIPIRTEFVEHLFIHRNSFIGDAVAGSIPAGHGGPGMWITSSRYASIMGNVASYWVTTAADGGQGCWLYLEEEGFSEGHHAAVVGNVTENLAIDTVIRCKGTNFNVFAGNNLGRNAKGTDVPADEPRGAFLLDPGDNYPGASCVIAANGIHNGGSDAPIVVDTCQNVLISGNDFSLLDPDVQIFTVANGGTVECDPSSNPISREL